jgi:hypothetical protein
MMSMPLKSSFDGLLVRWYGAMMGVACVMNVGLTGG